MITKGIAVYGGAFDPPHIGHLISISNLLNSVFVKEVLLVPSSDGRYDKAPVAPARDRLEMLRRMLTVEFGSESRVKIDEIQINNAQDLSCTIDLLENLSKKFPSEKIYFVIGSDNINQLVTWKSSEKLLSDYEFIVLPRERLQEKPPPNAKLHYLKGKEVIQCDVSSTQIRQLIKDGKSISGLVTTTVANFISDNKLYT